MKPSQLLFDLLEHFEGCKLLAYKDSHGIWTIGYGTVYYPNGSVVQEGDTCTVEEAQEYMIYHLTGLTNHLDTTITSNIIQCEFDSIVDFGYNAGQGAWDSSSLRVVVNSNPEDFNTIASNFLKWDKNHVNGELIEVEGLLRRRKCEAYLYQYGKNAPNFFQ